jgi:hypothetical protein
MMPIFKRSLLLTLVGAGVYCVACTDSEAPRTPGITVVSGGTGSDTIGVKLRDPLVVEVRSSDGRLAKGVEIEFDTHPVGVPKGWGPVLLSKMDGREFLYNIKDSTDAAGRASVLVALDAPAGEGEVDVRVPSLSMQATATYTVRPGAPTSIVVVPRDTPVVVGGTYVLRARSVDRRGDSVSSDAVFSTTSNAIQVTADGVVRGVDVGRARVGVAIGALTDSGLVSAVPHASIAVRDEGGGIGDSIGVAEVDLDGGNKRWIAKSGVAGTFYIPNNQLSPRWLPGTGQVVYSAPVDGGNRLFVSDTTRATRRLVDAASGLTREGDFDLSPDGAWVYFVGFETTGMQAIWRVPVNGGTPQRVTPDDYEYLTPSLSPDATRMAYVKWGRMYVRNLTTGATTMLSNNLAAGPVWSPTGEWIMYGQASSSAGFSGPLRLIHPDGSGDHVLIAGAYHPGGTWSPDGQYFVGYRAESDTNRMELIDVAAGARLPLIFRDKAWFAPSWRR